MSGFALPSPVGRPIAILGGGVLGRRIACSWAAAGYSVAIRDPSAEQRTAALEYCQTHMEEFPGKSATRGSVQVFADLAPAVETAWLVIEAVPEHLPLKITTFADLERLAPQDAILASNSSSYMSREMITSRLDSTKQRVINMHYYMPPSNVIVELMTCGNSDASIFPFLSSHLSRAGMHPFVARKESTGFIFNRLWAAIKREVLYILAEGVAEPDEVDALWKEMWYKNPRGPVTMMDTVGLDTVSFIEQHYIKERGLPTTAVDFLQKYIDEGRLGAKSSKGGLLPPAPATHEAQYTRDADLAPSPQLYFLDVGLSAEKNQFSSGRILLGGIGIETPKTLLSDLHTPDGIAISSSVGKIFWTSMGLPPKNDGSILSANLDGSDVREIVPRGHVHTPKQIAVDDISSKLYFSDREGLRVMRCNFDGSDIEVLIQNGYFRDETAKADQKSWCVGIAVSHKTGKFYWTQKGASKASQGRIFQANLQFLPGETTTNRTDVECIFHKLPEPIDLEVDEKNGVLYWSDRGELPYGNSVNRASLDKLTAVQSDAASAPGRDYELVVRNMHETIGIKVDTKNDHLYVTDLGGALYQFNLNGGNKKVVYSEDNASFAGITLSAI